MDSWVYYILGIAFVLLVYIYWVITRSEKEAEPQVPEMYSQYFSPEDMETKEGFYTKGYQRPVFLFIGGIILIVLFGVLNPGLADYVTMVRLSPFWIYVFLYMLLGGALSFFLSTLYNKSIFSKRVVIQSLMIVLIFVLFDLWFPIQIIRMNGDIVLARGYALSFDYVIFSLIRSLIGLDFLMVSYFGVMFSWLLVYVVTTPILIFTILFLKDIKVGSSSQSRAMI